MYLFMINNSVNTTRKIVPKRLSLTNLFFLSRLEKGNNKLQRKKCKYKKIDYMNDKGKRITGKPLLHNERNNTHYYRENEKTVHEGC